MKLNKLISLAVLLFVGLVVAQPAENSLVAEPAPASVAPAPVEDPASVPDGSAPATLAAENPAPVAEPASSASTPAETVAEPVSSSAASTEPVVQSTAIALVDSSSLDSPETTKKSGLLSGLYPVEKDEAIAKGRVYGGTSLSLIQGNTEDDVLNVMIGDVYEAYGYTFTVEAFGGYFIDDAMAIGLRAGYSRTWFDIDFALLEDLLDLKEHRKYVSNGFFFQPMLKNYLKVMDSRSVYVFNETSIKVEYSYGMSQTDKGDEMNKTRTSSWGIYAGINPGLCIMVLDRVAFETSVGLLGLSSKIIDVEENGETESRLVFNMVNFTINLLALDFSLVFFY